MYKVVFLVKMSLFWIVVLLRNLLGLYSRTARACLPQAPGQRVDLHAVEQIQRAAAATNNNCPRSWSCRQSQSIPATEQSVPSLVKKKYNWLETTPPWRFLFPTLNNYFIIQNFTYFFTRLNNSFASLFMLTVEYKRARVVAKLFCYFARRTTFVLDDQNGV